MRIAMMSAAVSCLAFAACVWQPYPQPPPRQSSRPDPVPISRTEPAPERSRPTQIGYLFYFKQPVPDGWTITDVTKEGGPEPSATPLCVIERDPQTKIIVLLKSYVPPDLTIDQFRVAILGDEGYRFFRMPPQFNRPPPDAAYSGHIAVGSFPGLDARWLVSVGRWPVPANEAMATTMIGMLTSMAVVSTEARVDGLVVEPKRQICALYF